MVLLSVRSVPNGQPVQYAPKAYFCTTGPRTSPPAVRSPIVIANSLPVFSVPENADRPVLVEKSIPVNIRNMWTTRIALGTSPLKRITAPPSSGTERMPDPRRRITRYWSFPAGGWSGSPALRSSPSLFIATLDHASSVLYRFHSSVPETELSGTMIPTGASESPA